MRKKLQEIKEVRKTFTGIFERIGFKNGYKGVLETVLLKDIKDTEGNYISDHLWFNLTKGFESLNLKQGDVIQFNARVKEYTKGYKGYREDVYKPIETDYKLSHPSQCKKIK